MTLLDLTFGAPQSRRRVLTCTIALLAAASGLAAHLSTRGARQHFAPENWSMTFRPPPGYLWERHGGDGDHAEFYRFMGTTHRGLPTELDFWRLRVAERDTPLRVGFALLNLDAPDPQVMQLAPQDPTPRTALLGGRSAVQLVHRSRQAVVRVVVLENLEAYAVRLEVDGQPLDDELLVLFDDVCAAARFPPE